MCACGVLGSVDAKPYKHINIKEKLSKYAYIEKANALTRFVRRKGHHTRRSEKTQEVMLQGGKKSLNGKKS